MHVIDHHHWCIHASIQLQWHGGVRTRTVGGCRDFRSWTDGDCTAGPSGRWVHVRCLLAPTRRCSTLQLKHRSTSPLHALLAYSGSVCTGAIQQRGRASRLVRGNPRINQSTCVGVPPAQLASWITRVTDNPRGTQGTHTN